MNYRNIRQFVFGKTSSSRFKWAWQEKMGVGKGKALVVKRLELREFQFLQSTFEHPMPELDYDFQNYSLLSSCPQFLIEKSACVTPTTLYSPSCLVDKGPNPVRKSFDIVYFFSLIKLVVWIQISRRFSGITISL